MVRVILVGSLFGFCPHAACSAAMHHDYGHEQNRDIRARLAAPAAAAAAAAVVSAAGTTRSETHAQPRKREVELLRLAAHGAVYPMYAVAPATDDDVAAIIRSAYGSWQFEHTTPGMRALIQSGNTQNVEVLARRTNAAVRAEAAAPTSANVASTAATVANLLPFAPFTGLAEFRNVLLRTVLPALIAQRPLAAANWLALDSSLDEITNTLGWSYAARYLEATLLECIANRSPIGAENQRTINGIAVAFATDRAAVRAPAAPRAAAAASASSLRPSQNTSNKNCVSFNFNGGCTSTQPCAYTHECFYYPECKAVMPAHHIATNCPLHPEKSALRAAATGPRGPRGGAARLSAATSQEAASRQAARPRAVVTPAMKVAGAAKIE